MYLALNRLTITDFVIQCSNHAELFFENGFQDVQKRDGFLYKPTGDFSTTLSCFRYNRKGDQQLKASQALVLQRHLATDICKLEGPCIWLEGFLLVSPPWRGMCFFSLSRFKKQRAVCDLLCCKSETCEVLASSSWWKKSCAVYSDDYPIDYSALSVLCILGGWPISAWNTPPTKICFLSRQR